MILPAMFHWSPSERRDQIFLHGLMPNQANVVSLGLQPHVCLSTSASMAWALSGGTGWSQVEQWDLWQVQLGVNDSVHIRPEFGNVVKEVTVRNVIPPDRIWYVGSRTV